MDSHNSAPALLDAVRALARADVALRLAHAPALRAVVRLAEDVTRSDDSAGPVDLDGTSVGDPTWIVADRDGTRDDQSFARRTAARG
jgi:hypothetical protein